MQRTPLLWRWSSVMKRGGRIHAIVRRTLIYKFQSTLIEGAAYSISNCGVGENSGEFKYSMHLYKLAKVKSFKGKVSLQNALHASKLIFNPDFDKAVELRKRLEENFESVSQPLSQIAEAPKMSIEEEFLTHTIMKTIEELKDTNEAPDKQFPSEICSLVDKTFLFKVVKKIVSNSRFEQSYKVRKLCSDSQLIQQFKDIHFSKKDLLTQFSDSVNDNENNFVLIGSADGVGITMDSECITPCKRNSDDFTDDPIVAASSMKMKKTIKQEKD
ncbi:hypothetical protein SESBI_34788 [Sesbania bispinosa]|nr:hypothetical protein SESBI_34788 [Sesbania bispinosa]